MTLQDIKEAFPSGQRVQYVGLTGKADGPIGTVWRVTTRGVWVTYPDLGRQQHHPEDLRLVGDQP